MKNAYNGNSEITTEEPVCFIKCEILQYTKTPEEREGRTWTREEARVAIQESLFCPILTAVGECVVKSVTQRYWVRSVHGIRNEAERPRGQVKKDTAPNKMAHGEGGQVGSQRRTQAHQCLQRKQTQFRGRATALVIFLASI